MSPSPVIRDFTATINMGEHLAIVGPSGSGKSTLVSLLEVIDTPQQGAIRVFGFDTAQTPTTTIRSLLTVVDQQTALLTGTVADNLRLAKPDATDDEMLAALLQANLDPAAEGWQDGLSTDVGERGRRLSGGQVQRIALARAFLRDVPIVILDEPTAQVDLASEQQIFTAIDRLTVHRAVITIAHRSTAVRHADRQISLALAQTNTADSARPRCVKDGADQ